MRKEISLYLIASILFLFSCSENETGSGIEPKEKAKGHVVYGGTFNYARPEKPATLSPHNLTDIGSAHVVAQMYDGLLKLNSNDLSIELNIAESYELSEDEKEYTFKLKKGIYFHDDVCFTEGKGRELKASDVKYSFELICSNMIFMTTFKDKLIGANEYHAGEADDVAGIEVVDDYTVKLKLIMPNSSFLYILANPMAYIVAKESIEKYGDLSKVGTGPFRYDSGWEFDKEVILVKNESYHQTDSLGNNLPYLDSIHLHVLNSKNIELEYFNDRKLEVISGLPAEKIKEIVEERVGDFKNKPPKFILDRFPQIFTEYYEFNLTREIFQNKKVRQAIAYAVNKQKIVDGILKGEAFGPGIYGLIPPSSFPGYDARQVKGYTYDPEKAKQLLSEAGYPNGEGFPIITLEVNRGGSNLLVASEIRQQLGSVLGINVELNIVSFNKSLENRRYAKSDMWRTGWIADYLSPENFLLLGYGADVPESLEEMSWPNTSRYNNPEFNTLFEAGMTSTGREESYENFLAAEKIMIEDAPVIPLWYNEKYRLIQSFVHGFYSNPIDFYDLRKVYLKSWEDKKGDNTDSN